jgi:ribonuclease E
MLQPTVQLRSGGYLVINQAEALVAIDVNSGRSTRERNVEETALRTNLEASDEVARQLRLRDLAGLIVIDFIDMESKRHNAMVERRLKEALKDDRARIQVGHISHFGLLEMSRQRLRPSLEETTLITCPHCNGTGHVRGTESAALHVLRGVEEEAGKRRSAEIIVHVAMAIALYILNHKRERLNEIERRYGMRVVIAADDALIAPRFRIDRVRTLAPGEEPRFVTPDAPRPALVHAAVDVVSPEPIEAEDDDDTADAEGDDADDAVAAGGEDTEENREAEHRRRRRRRRRGGREDKGRPVADPIAPDPTGAGLPAGLPADAAAAAEEPAADLVTGDDGGRRPMGGPRGSRRGRRRGGRDGDLPPLGVPGAEQPDLVPAYAGPTPADPFGGGAFDIFDVMEQAELNAAQANRAPAARREGGRSRWQPPHWAVASQPPMLVTDAVGSHRADRGPPVEAWALPSRPFMLRRDRHAPRWAQQRGAPRPAPEPAVAAQTRAVPIEAGPPPVHVPEIEQPVMTAPSPRHAEAEIAGPVEVQAELPWSAAEPAALEPVAAAVQPAPVAEEPVAADAPPVPANDVVSAPIVQPIVIGSEATPPLERKRGWWRRG